MGVGLEMTARLAWFAGHATRMGGGRGAFLLLDANEAYEGP